VSRSWWAVAIALVSLCFARSAAADVTLIENDGWTVFMNGRVQTFANYNDGKGRPRNVTDANCVPIIDPNTGMQTGSMCNSVELRGGGIDEGSGFPEWPQGTNLQTSTDPGLVREFRFRTGFTGNVLGFGIKKRISETTEFLAYSAVTVGIDSEVRRKFSEVRPDWRESFLRITGRWGSLTGGRTLTLHSRGALEVTYLYGYRYGLGFPGGVSTAGQSTAGSVGFGVLASGFGAGFAYATPLLGGFQLTLGAYDPNNIVATRALERTRWPRTEFEATFLRTFGATGLFKLFGNGAWQRLYDQAGTPRAADIWGFGYGLRFEIGPLRLGFAGHYGKGIGVTYALEPHGSLYFDDRARLDPTMTALVKMRNVDGYYLQLMVNATQKLSLLAGAGITRVYQLPEDKVAWQDTGGGMFPVPSVGFVTIKQQIGIGGGINVHFTPNMHLALEYFHAYFQWYKPVPAPAGISNPSQTMRSVNAGLTYDF
jgi:hypothetical protein